MEPDRNPSLTLSLLEAMNDHVPALALKLEEYGTSILPPPYFKAPNPLVCAYKLGVEELSKRFNASGSFKETKYTKELLSLKTDKLQEIAFDGTSKEPLLRIPSTGA